MEMGYLRADPVVTAAKHGPPIFTWSADAARRNGRRDVQQLFAEAERFGIHSGVSISVPVGFKHRMVFTLATKRARVDGLQSTDPATAAAAVAVAFVHTRLGLGASDASLSAGIRLSPREAECLRWFAEGMSMPDIAATLGIGYRSVRSCLDAATERLGAAYTRQAATIATRLGLI